MHTLAPEPVNVGEIFHPTSYLSSIVWWHQASDPSCICETHDRQQIISSITVQLHDFLVVCGPYIKPIDAIFMAGHAKQTTEVGWKVLSISVPFLDRINNTRLRFARDLWRFTNVLWLIDFCLFCKNLWKAVQFILLITYLCSFFLLIAIGQVDNKLCIRMCNFLKYWNISWGREQLLSRSSPVCSTPYPLRGLLHSCCSFRLTFSPFQRRACTVRFIWSKESMEAILAGCHWIQTIA